MTALAPTLQAFFTDRLRQQRNASDETVRAYRDAWRDSTRIHAFCEDYRAGATVDPEADEKDRRAGRTIQCRVNDRGPFIRGRIVDLSVPAARALGMMSAGVVRVSVE